MHEITALKVDWLRRRRADLRARYDAISARAAAAPDPIARLAVLREGLAALRAGAELLHPEAALIEDVLAIGSPTVALDDATAQLERELAWGRARAEYGWSFAALIDEWVATADDAGPVPPAPQHALPVFDLEALGALDPLVEEPAWVTLRTELAEQIAQAWGDPVDGSDVEEALSTIADGPYRARALRRQARAIARDETLCGEYTSALAVLVDEASTWRWPVEGVASRVVVAAGKPRVYLEPEMLDALFCEIVGRRWVHALSYAFASWSRATEDAAETPDELDAELAHIVEQSTTSRPFGTLLENPGSSNYVAADAVFDAPDALELQLGAIDGRIRGWRAVAPDRPVFVVTADIAALGPTIPHEVLDRVAERLGVTDEWRTILARILAVPVRTPDGVAPTRRGIHPDQPLLLGFVEALLAMISARITRATGIGVVRVVDDFAFVTNDAEALARAWTLFGALLGAAGLALRPEKTRGTVLFGEAELPAGVPRVPVRWGHLVLEPDGSWSIDPVAVDAARAETWERTARCRSVLEAAHVFSDGVRTTLRRLGPFAPFGAAHVARVAAAMAPFYTRIDGTSGIVEHLASRLRQRLPDVDLSTLPTGVWYWPRTAGGVGLFDVTAQLAGLHAWWRKYVPPALPAQRSSYGGSRHYGPLWIWLRTPSIQPRQPPFTPELSSRIVAFVKRGNELRGVDTDEERSPERLRHGLSFYWQWVVALHGPSVLARFGTFRFVEVSRMPFGAIVELGWLGPVR